MIKKLNEINEALPAMFLADAVYLIIGEIVILFLPFGETMFTVKCMVGFLAGVIYSAFCSVHMSLRIRRVVYGGDSMRKTFTLGYLIRLAVMLALFAALFLLNIGDLLCAVIGMFSMKVAAYIWPFTDKVISKLKKRKVRRWEA
ncbi:MAG: hypothetical protein ACI4E1_04625 [Lachnospira sp.]